MAKKNPDYSDNPLLRQLKAETSDLNKQLRAVNDDRNRINEGLNKEQWDERKRSERKLRRDGKKPV